MLVIEERMQPQFSPIFLRFRYYISRFYVNQTIWPCGITVCICPGSLQI